MAYCDVWGNFDDFLSFENKDKNDPDYQPDLYYYWDAPLEEDYDWRDNFPEADCLCEICFDIANEEGKIKWAWIITVCKHYIDLAPLPTIIEV